MTTDGGLSRDGCGPAATTQGIYAHRWVRVSWEYLAGLCRGLAGQLLGDDRPDMVVALARAGYVPGAILASLLRCDLVTLRVPPVGSPGRLATRLAASMLQPQLSGRRTLIFDETLRTGEALAWATCVAVTAGASCVNTAVLIQPPGSPRADFCAAIQDGHVLQPWAKDCV